MGGGGGGGDGVTSDPVVREYRSRASEFRKNKNK